ncbi:Protein of unknown function [Pyronema omphalodes CBS 100304]|uniref:Uncharacterized protein n=1 Tax=Pyronema omphalodes (strain CBS 100304) TaxID=1076935 RepID=U4LU37_PYROM|nr:Protein of unknown function [Pyronema omphalodes CBS 100304]
MSVPPISAHSDLTSFISPSYPRPRYTHDCRFRNPYPRLPTTDDLITIPTLLSPPFHSKLPPRPPVAPYLEIIIQRILNSFPPSWLLEPKSGEMFRTKQDATRRMQAFAFYSGVALYPEYNRKGRADKMRFSCVHFHPKWEERRIVEIPGTQSLGRNRLIQRVVRSFSGGGLRSVGLGCRCNVNLVRRSVGNGEGKEKEVWVLAFVGAVLVSGA